MESVLKHSPSTSLQDLGVDPDLVTAQYPQVHPISPIDKKQVDRESAYEVSLNESATATLDSSVVDYVYENGRRYHRYQEGRYLLPNDETEQDRLDLQHHIFCLLQGGQLFFAPIDSNPHRILDIGTGTGIWALDVAEQYPGAEVIGTDLSPIQPTWVYNNCRFEVDDAESEWTFPENHFGFIHCRGLLHSIQDWSKLLQQMYRSTKPGGYIELTEVELQRCHSHDNTLPQTAAVAQAYKLMAEAMRKIGRPSPDGEALKKHAENAGFVDVELITLKQPFSPWPKDPKMKEVGKYMLHMMHDGIEAFMLAIMTRLLGKSPEEAAGFARRARKDLLNKKYRIYSHVWYVIARKPDPGSDRESDIEDVRNCTIGG